VRVIEAILNQDVFSALLVLTGIFLLIKQRHLEASAAVLFFIAGYFCTQIPLVSGYMTGEPEKFIAQASISLCLVAFYSSINVSLPVLVACINEVILIFLNMVFTVVDIHPWHHWAAFSAINYLSFFMLVINWRQQNKRFVSERVFGASNAVKAWSNVYTSDSNHLQKNKEVAREGKC
jgi:hypothetical protein